MIETVITYIVGAFMGLVFYGYGIWLVGYGVWLMARAGWRAIQ